MDERVRLFGAIAVRPAVAELLPDFEAASGLTVAPLWEVNPTLRAQIEAGAPFDLVIINPDMIHDLTLSGRVSVGSQKPFGRISMGVAARAGARPADIGSVAAFTRALREARSIAYVRDGSSGRHFRSLLERLGILGEVESRLVATPGGQAGAAVARGEAEVAVIPMTSILAAGPEVMLVGRFPAELRSFIDFAVGVSANTHDLDAAERLSDFLTSPARDGVLAAWGVDRS